MRQQFTDSPFLPAWADGLPPDVVALVRQEAHGRGIAPTELVKEWVLKSARNFVPELSKELADSK